MAEKLSYNEQRKKLEEPDAFQESLFKAAHIIKEYKKPLLLGLVALIIAVGAFWATMASFQRSQENASDLLAKAVSVYKKSKDPKAGYQAVEKEYQKIFEEYANTSAGKMARIRFAQAAYAAGDYDTAYEMYTKAYEEFKSDPYLKELLLLSLGNLSVSRKEYDKGMDFFDDARNYKGGIWKEQAIFMMAQLYDLKKDTENSQKMYEQLPEKQPPSMYQEMAKDRMSQLF